MLSWKKEGTKIYQGLPKDLYNTLKPCEPLRSRRSRANALRCAKRKPGKPIRLMVGLHILKHRYNCSDERAVEELQENAYWQCFCGFETFQTGVLLEATSLVKFRNRLGAEGMKQIEAVLLRPLPYHEPDRLVRLYESEAAPGRYPLTGPDFIDWKTQNNTFSDMALFFWRGPVNLSGDGRADAVWGVRTEANFFSLLGVKPMLGRTFAHGEDQPVAFSVQIDSGGGGQWRNWRSVSVPARSYTHVVLPEDLQSEWLRLETNRNAGAATSPMYTP